MPDLESAKYKHLTIDDRKEIMECLEKGMTFKAIARRIGKDPTTISKEVKKHRTPADADKVTTTKGDGTPIDGRVCPHLLRAPFVCNPCERRRRQCPFQKQLYIAPKAHHEYETLLRDARDGVALNKDEFWSGNAIITEQMKKGQRLYHIMETFDVGFSKSSAYRHLHKGYLSVGKLNMPRVPKFKARKQYKISCVPKAVRVGRTYDDFKAFVEANEVKHWVEMDTVIGKIGGKVIMTFHFTLCNFMFGLLLDNKTAAEAACKVRALKSAWQKNGVSFKDIMPLLLTDNGGEFAHVAAFTDGLQGEKESDLFFCDPYCSSQKPRVEKNHTMFRDIVPKGTPFDNFTQDTVNLIFSHVNCIKRKVLNAKTPYDMFTFLYPDVRPDLFGVTKIPAEQVVQSPLLLQKLKLIPVNDVLRFDEEVTSHDKR